MRGCQSTPLPPMALEKNTNDENTRNSIVFGCCFASFSDDKNSFKQPLFIFSSRRSFSTSLPPSALFSLSSSLITSFFFVFLAQKNCFFEEGTELVESKKDSQDNRKGKGVEMGKFRCLLRVRYFLVKSFVVIVDLLK